MRPEAWPLLFRIFWGAEVFVSDHTNESRSQASPHGQHAA